MPQYVARTIRGDASIIDHIAPAWRSLATEAPNSWPMYAPSWLRTWHAAFGNGTPLVIVTVSEGNRLVAVAPFLDVRRGPLRIWRGAANFYSGKSDIAVRPHDRDAILGVLWQEIERQPWMALDWRLAPEDGNLAALVAQRQKRDQPATVRQTHRTPVVRIGPDVDVDRLGPAKKLRKARRQLASLGHLTEVVTSPATPENVQTFFRLEAEGWKGRMGTDAGSDKASANFYRALVDLGDHPDFTAIAHEIKLDNETIAIDIGVRDHQRHFALKGSYAEAWQPYSPGHLSCSFVIRECQASGLTTFDFLGVDEPYKLTWTDVIEPLQHVMVFHDNPVGRVAQAAIDRGIPLSKRCRGFQRNTMNALHHRARRSMDRIRMLRRPGSPSPSCPDPTKEASSDSSPAP